MTNIIEINEQVTTDDGASIDLHYVGEKCEDIMNNSAYPQLIKTYLLDNSHLNIVANIKGIRHIFDDFKELELILTYRDQYTTEKVVFYNGNLVLYESNDKVSESYNDVTFGVKYTDDNTLKFYINDKIESENFINILSKISYQLDKIEELNHGSLRESISYQRIRTLNNNKHAN